MEMKPPKIIYLQWAPDGETTWCEDEINDDDIAYVLRADLEIARAERDRIAEALRQVIYLPSHNPHLTISERMQSIIEIATDALENK